MLWGFISIIVYQKSFGYFQCVNLNLTPAAFIHRLGGQDAMMLGGTRQLRFQAFQLSSFKH